MTEAPTPEEIQRWQKFFAVECNNRTWDLASQDNRTAIDNDEMLFSAFAAAYHWKFAGGPLQHARAEVTIAHTLSLLGHGDLAMQFARRALDYFLAQKGAGTAQDWDIAFAYMELAFAAQASGNTQLHQDAYAQALLCGEGIADETDRSIFFTEFGRIPKP